MVAGACAMLLVGVGANEANHGALSEWMGLGHHHLTDHGGVHCASPGEPDWDRHVEHVHHGGQNGTHDHCDGAHMDDHGGMR